MTGTTYTVKIVFNEEIRRLPFSLEKGLQGLNELYQNAFAFKNPNAFQLTYQDAEGDNIVLSSNEELASLFKNTDTVKFTLQRKAVKKCGAKSQETPVVSSSSSESSTSSSETSTPPTKEGKKCRKEKAREEGKKERKDKKERRKALKAQIAATKVVRLRWKELNVVDENEPRKAKKQGKGCYFGASVNRKLKFHCGLGKKSLWISHKLNDNTFVFAPLTSPKRFIRVFPDGTVNLSNGGFGPRTRWNIVQGTDGNTHLVSNHLPNFQLGAVSIGKKNKKNEEGFSQKKRRVAARGVDVAGALPENVLSANFTIEEVDAAQLLVRVVKQLSRKRRAFRKAGKERRAQWKKNFGKKKEGQDQEREKEWPHGHGHGHGHGGCHRKFAK